MDDLRRKRVGEDLRSEISTLIQSGDVKDPRVNSFLSITRVDVAKDASFARVYVSTFQDDALDRGVEGLNRAAGFMQSAVGKRIRLRQTPKLTFIADRGIKEGFEINEKIKDILS
ncbi:MAG: 30S ribosome-binding factor RbfA [Spirochaetes bacterium]|nr:30S ribosome-binding factor RbfA [Spirochaetota bacterium]